MSLHLQGETCLHKLCMDTQYSSADVDKACMKLNGSICW